MAHGYTNNSYPTTGIKEVLTVTYYDNYGFKSLSDFDAKFDFDYTNGINAGPYMAGPRGMVTGGKTKVLNDGTWLRSATYYDDKLRAIQTVSEAYGAKYARTATAYDFTGNVTDTKTVYVMDDDSEEQVRERFEYDHANRLVNTWHSVDGQPEVLMANNQYDAIGRLTDKKLHSTDGGNTYDQSIDYRYNIRGWLTSINNAGRTDDGQLNDDANDLFGMELSYESSPAGLSFTGQYNGNISGMRWSNGHDGTQKSYGFGYDGMNRILDASYKEKSAAGWDTNTGHFDTYGISYDKNGNIQTLLRRENDTITDNLSYAYKNLTGNRLASVNDNTNNAKGFTDGAETSDEYGYDNNGNMIRDDNKKITAITYNMLNLPETVDFGNGKKIEYVYDAAGAKWRKIVTDGTTTDTTGYIGNMILENHKLKLMHTAEGRIVVSRVGNENDYKYQYVLKDHLGNSRVTFGASQTEYLATMESELANEEEAQFNGIAEYREQNFMFNHTTGGEFTPDESVMLNSTLADINGVPRVTAAMKGLKVQAGDTVNMEVWAKYINPGSGDEVDMNSFLFAALTTGFGLVATGETMLAHDAFGALLNEVNLVNQSTDEVPKAFLNYIFFNESYDTLATYGGFSQISNAANGNFEKLNLTFTAQEAGYLYIYVSNESNLDVNVYFDDLKITHTSALTIVQADDYYPFGLTFNSYQRPGETEQKYLYNGKELQSDLGLNLISTDFRMYDPALGRFNTADALTDYLSSISPYSFAYNNPIWFSDPTGLMPTDTLPGITITAKPDTQSDNFWLIPSYTFFNPVQRAMKMRYEKGDFNYLRTALYDRSLSYGEGLGYETDFMKGFRRTLGGIAMVTGGIMVASVASPVLLENLSGSLSLKSGFGAALGNMGKELAIQETGNLLTGQSLKNVDLSDIAIAGLPGAKWWIQPAIAGTIDYTPFSEGNQLQIGIIGGKSFGKTVLDVATGLGTKGLNGVINKSDIEKTVVKIFTNWNELNKGVANSFVKKGISKK